MIPSIPTVEDAVKAAGMAPIAAEEINRQDLLEVSQNVIGKRIKMMTDAIIAIVIIIERMKMEIIHRTILQKGKEPRHDSLLEEAVALLAVDPPMVVEIHREEEILIEETEETEIAIRLQEAVVATRLAVEAVVAHLEVAHLAALEILAVVVLVAPEVLDQEDRHRLEDIMIRETAILVGMKQSTHPS